MTRQALLLITLLVLLSACSGNQEPTPAPLAAAPTNTLLPTATPIPANTQEPTATPTPVPTDTPTLEPTATPTATETPAPTDTPTPTATPEPVAVVTGDRLNVRGGPGTVYPVIAQAVKDERYPLLARNEDATWLEVALVDGQRGWVSASLVESSTPAETLVVATDIPPTPVPTPAPVAPSSVTAGALSQIRMIASGDPLGTGRSRFPSGVAEVWCAFDVNSSLGQPGQRYALRVTDSGGTVIAQNDLISFTEGLRPGVKLALASPAIRAPGGVFPNGVYRTEILLNGQVIATLVWSVGE